MSLVFALFLIGVPLALAGYELSRMKGAHPLRVGPPHQESMTQPAEPTSKPPSHETISP